MEISKKIMMNQKELIENGPITIVAFGDSVTHGAVGPGEFNYETVYWNRLRKKINELNNYVPVNVIDAGIAGLTAKESLGRMEKQVFLHHPDLVIVCFGLNDINGTCDEYVESMKRIFERCQSENCDTIFMTPNTLNTYIADDTDESLKAYAAKTAEIQNSGRMDEYIYAAVSMAEAMGIKVCDCYSKWKKLSETEDTTMLLANRINHPVKEMHELFANELFQIIFEK